jgi:hypothetical protein
MPLYATRGGRAIFTSLSEFRRRHDLPYGKWTCADGREVLFNRFYEPIWQRRPDGAPEPADAREWVGYKTQVWFYNDGHREPQKVARGKAALTDWLIPIPHHRYKAIPPVISWYRR